MILDPWKQQNKVVMFIRLTGRDYFSVTCQFYFIFQEYGRNCLHQACARTSGAIEIVRALTKAMGKEAKLIPDLVSYCNLFYLHLQGIDPNTSHSFFEVTHLVRFSYRSFTVIPIELGYALRWLAFCAKTVGNS